MFVESPVGRFSDVPNLALRDASPLKNAGTDGTDIGPSGGTTPFDRNFTSLPVVQELSTSGLVRAGSDLQIDVKAKSR